MRPRRCRTALLAALAATVLTTARAESPAGGGASAPAITLADAMRLASSNRIDVRVQAAAVDAARAGQRAAGSAWGPQMQAHGRYSRIDEDRAEASFRSQPEDRTVAGASLTQVLYDEDARAGRASAGRALEAQRALAEETRLDAMAAAGARFVDLLSARALQRIDQDNLKLTQSNLDLARVRQQVGTAGPEEVYRWEAQEARQRGAVIASEARVHIALASLNQAMSCAQDTAWEVREVEAEGPADFLGGRLLPYLGDAAKFAALLDFAIAEALRTSPALRALDEQAAVARIQRDSLRRRGYLPSIAASVTYDRVLDETFTGPGFGAASDTSAPETDDDEWVAALSATLPLFESGGRLARVARAQAELDRLTASRESARQSIEERLRAALQIAAASQPNIGLSALAADRARRNLDVIQDKYANGTVPILDLLDAQNQSQVEAQNAALAVHRYVKAILEVQRALGWFDLDVAAAGKDDWVRRLEAFTVGRGSPTP